MNARGSTAAAGAVAPASPHVTILMAVRNGAALLPEQLDSFARQQHRNWSLLAGDDGSTDDSRAVLERFAEAGHDVRIIEGPRRGAWANFLRLVQALPEHAPAGTWVAFSDQDDVWLPERLSRGLAQLPADGPPALYCSRTWITDVGLRGRRLSAPRPRPPSFRNALVQNIASGNTILLNPAAVRLLVAASKEPEELVVHDWWVYLLITGAGGVVVHDDTPTILYRQHSGNQIGANDGMRARLRRAGMILDGTFRSWHDANIDALRRSAHRLTAENRQILDEFAALRGCWAGARVSRLARLGLYRQSRLSSLALWVAAASGRV